MEKIIRIILSVILKISYEDAKILRGKLQDFSCNYNSGSDLLSFCLNIDNKNIEGYIDFLNQRIIIKDELRWVDLNETQMNLLKWGI